MTEEERKMKAKVYFSKDITPEKVVELYRALGRELPGRVAVKVHSGEPGNQNFLTPEFWQPMIEAVHGTVVECNTAYPGERNTTEAHRRTMIKHGWSKLFDVTFSTPRVRTSSLPFRTASASKRILSAGTWPITTPCSCSRTSRATRWAASAAR